MADDHIRTVVSVWDETLSSINSTVLPDKESQVANLQHLNRGSVALAILSLFLATAIFASAIVSLTTRFMEGLRLWQLYVLCVVDAALFLGSGLLAKDAAANNEFQGIINAAASFRGKTVYPSAGPALLLLLGGAFVKLVAIGVVAAFVVVASLFLVILVVSCFCGCEEEEKIEVYHYYDYNIHRMHEQV